MDRREKEDYLREYSQQKNQGKAFFPYAVAKDGAMALITLLVIIASALGPSSAPRISAIAMITSSVMRAIAPSLATAYGKNALPWFFCCEYSRR